VSNFTFASSSSLIVRSSGVMVRDGLATKSSAPSSSALNTFSRVE
jgi:hypothetical protein